MVVTMKIDRRQFDEAHARACAPFMNRWRASRGFRNGTINWLVHPAARPLSALVAAWAVTSRRRVLESARDSHTYDARLFALE